MGYELSAVTDIYGSGGVSLWFIEGGINAKGTIVSASLPITFTINFIELKLNSGEFEIDLDTNECSGYVGVGWRIRKSEWYCAKLPCGPWGPWHNIWQYTFKGYS